jgi:hypothetical protein
MAAPHYAIQRYADEALLSLADDKCTLDWHDLNDGKKSAFHISMTLKLTPHPLQNIDRLKRRYHASLHYSHNTPVPSCSDRVSLPGSLLQFPCLSPRLGSLQAQNLALRCPGYRGYLIDVLFFFF